MTSALESSIHMEASLWATFKESVSHLSENCGNCYHRVECRAIPPCANGVSVVRPSCQPHAG
ncbi:MAG: hypothetical protein F6Q13_03725 [Mycobacterium sp.]|nr:MAG: hypothetical protein F6Q13_03725 [Mycobacterium sp.]